MLHSFAKGVNRFKPCVSKLCSFAVTFRSRGRLRKLAENTKSKISKNIILRDCLINFMRLDMSHLLLRNSLRSREN